VSDRTRPLAVYAVFFVAVALAAGIASYVYKHEPPRDQLQVTIQATAAPEPSVVSGSLTAIDGDSLTLTTADGTVTLALTPSAPIEELQHAGAPLPDGAQVNVGVEDTEFGQVLTGIVAIEDGG